ncbi:receptor-interacting serine/threonine-protein kinase 4-like [Neodiprion pinetum]|uniref:receptor-interacting serine/threonine-protein kinase 4-like n=1 Tax=Neodiprion pinetum TaxID=441929 RepID=UPI001EDEEFEB|nr:alpha-latrotoxin-Lhe1a-like [Neodiprion pinetum]XP_046470325.1 alpha-latrotoxin-Lhe1a-like [Neodiprion pinetum]
MAAIPEAVIRFFEAVKSNDIEKVVGLLKSKEVDVNAVDVTSDNQTAVHLAAFRGYEKMLRILVDEYNADINIADKIGEIPLQIACDKYNVKIAKYLIEKNSNFPEYAESYLNDKLVDELFEAAESNDVQKVTELIKNKSVDVNSIDKGNYNRTILHIAVMKGYEELARLLVDEFNADTDYEDEIGDTAKNMAIDYKHANLAELLARSNSKELKLDAEVSQSDSNSQLCKKPKHSHPTAEPDKPFKSSITSEQSYSTGQ